jgi:hypothetical protein
VTNPYYDTFYDVDMEYDEFLSHYKESIYGTPGFATFITKDNKFVTISPDKFASVEIYHIDKH